MGGSDAVFADYAVFVGIYASGKGSVEGKENFNGTVVKEKSQPCVVGGIAVSGMMLVV
ncbi:hypothetical protein Barb7_02186 [Bacteroidales bacterium Barb7]|nr:hypothetical protein Barb7_02186 [Bacteroidales bacterium Barb7]